MKVVSNSKSSKEKIDSSNSELVKNMKVVSKLKVLMAEKDITQEELAKEVGISTTFINKLANNKITEIRMEHLYKLRKFFKCKSEKIIDFEEFQENKE